MSVGDPTTGEIPGRQRGQHRRDQRCPSIDAAAEIGVEVARAQHLEAHDDGAGNERASLENGTKCFCRALAITHLPTLTPRARPPHPTSPPFKSPGQFIFSHKPIPSPPAHLSLPPLPHP